jgi:hypothetical protein
MGNYQDYAFQNLHVEWADNGPRFERTMLFLEGKKQHNDKSYFEIV